MPGQVLDTTSVRCFETKQLLQNTLLRRLEPADEVFEHGFW
jgi:hypothetical protein